MKKKEARELKGRDKQCPNFPCHEDGKLEDCTFCYCPFYPCYEKRLGGKMITDKNGERIWDCSDCTHIHNRKTVSFIYDYLTRNKRFLDAVRRVMLNFKYDHLKAISVNGKTYEVIEEHPTHYYIRMGDDPDIIVMKKFLVDVSREGIGIFDPDRDLAGKLSMSRRAGEFSDQAKDAARAKIRGNPRDGKSG